jgi:hypothetical protein
VFPEIVMMQQVVMIKRIPEKPPVPDSLPAFAIPSRLKQIGGFALLCIALQRLRLATALIRKASATRIRHPNLHRAQAGFPQSCAMLPRSRR